MFIETWILVMVILFLGGGSIISLLGWMRADAKNEELQFDLDREKENAREFKWQLATLRAKNNVNVANEYYEERKK